MLGWLYKPNNPEPYNALHQARIGYTWKRTEQTPQSTIPSLQVAGFFTGGGSTAGHLNDRERDLEIDAARYIAARIGKDVPITASLRVYSLKQVAVRTLRERFDIFVVQGGSPFFPAFQDALRFYGASYFWTALPRPHRDVFAILLPKNLPRGGISNFPLRFRFLRKAMARTCRRRLDGSYPGREE